MRCGIPFTGPPSRFSYAGGKSAGKAHTRGWKAGSQPVAGNPAPAGESGGKHVKTKGCGAVRGC